jgi:hypothetical protein
MNCISIGRCENYSYQIDHIGTEHDCVAAFESRCLVNNAIWAHLFDQLNGKQIATYNDIQGLTMIP